MTQPRSAFTFVRQLQSALTVEEIEKVYLNAVRDVIFARGRGLYRVDDTTHTLGPGGLARVDAATVRKIKNVGDEPAVYLVAGGKDGYVGRDGRLPEGETSRAGPSGQ